MKSWTYHRLLIVSKPCMSYSRNVVFTLRPKPRNWGLIQTTNKSSYAASATFRHIRLGLQLKGNSYHEVYHFTQFRSSEEHDTVRLWCAAANVLVFCCCCCRCGRNYRSLITMKTSDLPEKQSKAKCRKKEANKRQYERNEIHPRTVYPVNAHKKWAT